MRPLLRSVRTAALVMALGAAPAPAQQRTPAAPGSPRACADSMRTLDYHAYAAAHTAHRKLDRKALDSAVVREGRKCAAPFDVATMPAGQLGDLADVYAQLGDLDRVDRVFARVEHDSTIADTTRINTLLNSGQSYGNFRGAATDSLARVRADAAVVALTRHVDSIATIPMDHFRAKAVLFEWSRADDEDVKNAAARALLKLGQSLPPATGPNEAVGQALMAAAGQIAEMYGNRLEPDSALATIRTTLASPYVASLDPQWRERLMNEERLYGLIGQHAPVLHAEHVANGAAPSLTGKVSIVMFTAHWCHDCLTSYPAIVRVTHDMAAQGLQTVVVIDLEGSFDGTPVTPVAEVEANRHYYADEHGFHSPIVFQSPLRITQMGKPRPKDHDNSDLYGVDELPTYVIVDRTGTVRAALIDWDATGHRERVLTDLLRRLVAGQSATAADPGRPAVGR